MKKFKTTLIATSLTFTTIPAMALTWFNISGDWVDGAGKITRVVQNGDDISIQYAKGGVKMNGSISQKPIKRFSITAYGSEVSECPGEGEYKYCTSEESITASGEATDSGLSVLYCTRYLTIKVGPKEVGTFDSDCSGLWKK